MTQCANRRCSRRAFMDSDYCVNHTMDRTSLKIWFAFVGVVVLVILCVGVWAVVQVVEWVITK